MAKKTVKTPVDKELDALDTDVNDALLDEDDVDAKFEHDVEVGEEALAEEPAAEPMTPIKPAGFTLLLEDGSRVSASNNQLRAFRAQDDDGHSYDHCADAPDGEWIYRPV